MASAAFSMPKTYHPSVNGPETMPGPDLGAKPLNSGPGGYGGGVIIL